VLRRARRSNLSRPAAADSNVNVIPSSNSTAVSTWAGGSKLFVAVSSNSGNSDKRRSRGNLRKRTGRLRRLEAGPIAGSESQRDWAQRNSGADGDFLFRRHNSSGSQSASFKLSLDEFIAKRGGAAIVSRGRAMMGANAALFASIEKRFGVPPGPLIAIWGMETGFGANTGNANTISAVATLAYDCRRPAYFTDHLYAALQLVDEGVLSANTRGAMHGEVGQTQFLPKSILLMGSMAMATGASISIPGPMPWPQLPVRGTGYQPGQPNFAAIQGWNAARVYEEAIATIGRQIDEH